MYLGHRDHGFTTLQGTLCTMYYVLEKQDSGTNRHHNFSRKCALSRLLFLLARMDKQSLGGGLACETGE